MIIRTTSDGDVNELLEESYQCTLNAKCILDIFSGAALDTLTNGYEDSGVINGALEGVGYLLGRGMELHELAKMEMDKQMELPASTDEGEGVEA